MFIVPGPKETKSIYTLISKESQRSEKSNQHLFPLFLAAPALALAAELPFLMFLEDYLLAAEALLLFLPEAAIFWDLLLLMAEDTLRELLSLRLD